MQGHITSAQYEFLGFLVARGLQMNLRETAYHRLSSQTCVQIFVLSPTGQCLTYRKRSGKVTIINIL